MKKGFYLTITIISSIVLLLSSSALAVPGFINYQGKLTDTSGVPLDGFYNMRFNIYNVATGGASMWNEQQNNISVVDGFLSVHLGSATSFPPGLFDNDYLYLEIAIENSGTGLYETLSPRQQLTSVPFAMKAEFSEEAVTLNGYHASDFLSLSNDFGRSGVAVELYEGAQKLTEKYVNEGQANSITSVMITDYSVGSSDLAANSVTSAKIANGAVGTTDIGDNAVTSAKIQNGTIQEADLAFSMTGDNHSLDASDGSPANAVYVDSVGKVGIGTTTPLKPLDWLGRVGFGAYSETSLGYDGRGLYLELKDGGYAYKPTLQSYSHNQFLFDYGTELSAPEGNLKLTSSENISLKSTESIYFTAGTYTNMLTINSSGSIGIGIDDPQFTLDLHTNSGSYNYMKFTNNDTGSGHTDGWLVGMDQGENFRIHAWEETGDIAFYTQDKHRMRIKNTGNVGIGTADPAEMLHVEGTVMCKVLTITGGADIAEPFDIKKPEMVHPGMVLSIDAENPGKLKVSEKAYDKCVAGIVSGAGKVNPGMIMGQKGSLADGEYPVALTGRVYCLGDASNGAIQPGDLLTTSHTPGYAMKVTDYEKAQGSVIGKAMSPLETGKGLILVLVTLQ